MLEIKNISKIFNAGTVNEKVAIDNLSLSLKDGDPLCSILLPAHLLPMKDKS